MDRTRIDRVFCDSYVSLWDYADFLDYSAVAATSPLALGGGFCFLLFSHQTTTNVSSFLRDLHREVFVLILVTKRVRPLVLPHLGCLEQPWCSMDRHAGTATQPASMYTIVRPMTISCSPTLPRFHHDSPFEALILLSPACPAQTSAMQGNILRVNTKLAGTCRFVLSSRFFITNLH